MSFDWVTIVATLVAGGVPLGLVALFFLSPALFGVVIEGLQSFFTSIIATRLGCALLAAVLAATAADQYRVHVDGAAYTKGISYEKAKWDAANAAAVKRGKDARAEAETEITPIPGPALSTAAPVAPTFLQRIHGVVPVRRASRMRDDQYDRDQH